MQLLSTRREKEQPLATVGLARFLADVPGVDQLPEHPAETLLGDPEDVEEFGDADAGMAPDEVDDPVMGATEAIVLEDLVGIGHEVPIGEEQELDQLHDRPLGIRPALGGVLSALQVYVSHVDIYTTFC